MYAQQIFHKIDSAQLEFKAKLLTLTKRGLAEQELVLEDVLSQEISYLTTGSDQILALRIPFSQSFFLGDEDRRIELWGECDFVVVYYLRNNQFYRIQGFGEGDIISFANDLSDEDILSIYESLLTRDVQNNGNSLDIVQLIEYSELSRRKRLKRSFDFIYDCEEQIADILTSSSGEP